MAIQWMDFPSGSTGIYGTNPALMSDGPYANVQGFLVEDPDPAITGNVYQLLTSIGSGVALRKILPASATTVGIAWRNWMSVLPADGLRSYTLWLRNDSGVGLARIYVGPAGQIQISNLSSVVATSAIDLIKTNSWQHIEVKFNLTTGQVLVYLNGDEVMDETVDISGSAAMVSWERSFDQAGNQYIKDYVIYDGTGGWGTGPLGTVAVYDLSPNGDVSSGWVPSTGTSASNILDNSPPNDSQYISATDSPLPDPCIVTLSSLPDDVTSVRALMTVIRARKSDGGDGNLQVGLISDGDTDNGADRPITTAFAYYTDISNIDPSTGSAWTPSAVDDATLSIDRTL